ncbi:hypothetical protein [Massilia niastensis]|uniref:hypothetical protein n=1 Tax=Massilia niastensis TaxID=544911 RepID=UPI000378CFD4|nr:hypothetical protein [Massilia niastensis]
MQIRAWAWLVLFAALPLRAAVTLPADVERFLEQRDTCEHFRGEIPEPQEVERMKDVNLQIDRYCRGTDRRLARLKKKYSRNAAVRRRLDGYEAKIEPAPEHQRR